MCYNITMPKVLIVIPAHNEAGNIGKVLDEIKHDMDFADIVVIDDTSTDNTTDIVRAHGVNCINNIFNLGYAWTIQTGIKYAVDNDYDYLIQMDADGQHIAKEAARLYEYVTSHDVDIVIGSRYLEDTGYKCPFFRRIGTKLFSWLIKIFCHQKITDPLSGFQCLDRRVMERYAKMGAYPEFPDANLILEMLLCDYKVHEIPVRMRMRETGESMHRGIIGPISYMINMCYAVVFVFLQYFGFRKRIKRRLKR